MPNKLVAGLSLAITLLLPVAVACDSFKPVQGEGSMPQSLAVPILDTQVPPVTETATFALG